MSSTCCESQQIDDYLRGIRGNENTRDGIDLLQVEEEFKALYDRYLNELASMRRELNTLQAIPRIDGLQSKIAVVRF